MIGKMVTRQVRKRSSWEKGNEMLARRCSKLPMRYGPNGLGRQRMRTRLQQRHPPVGQTLVSTSLASPVKKLEIRLGKSVMVDLGG